MSFVLGLTGSIAMGKSTTAQMFRDLGIPVWDADAVVHGIYATDATAAAAMEKLIPGSGSGGHVDRAVLKGAIARDDDLLPRIEKIVHPRVAENRRAFLTRHQSTPLVVLDVPLLFETGGESYCDATVVVTTQPAEQRRRAQARGMHQQDFEDLLSRQLPDPEKRARSTYVIETDTLDGTRASVADLVSKITGATS